MLIDMRRHAAVDVVRPNGRIVLGDGVDEFRQALDELIANGRSQIVLRLSDVPMIDSSGIGVLVRTQTTLRQQGGSIKLVNPSKFASLSLRTTGIFRLFDCYDDEEVAVNAFSE